MTDRAATSEQVQANEGFLIGGGEMGALMRACDWSETPLGPVEQWPQSLRSALSICLGATVPIALWWGPELVMFYNDAYRPLLGAAAHPRALGQGGRAGWPEMWQTIGPLLEKNVMRRGEATVLEEQRLLLDRNGYLEECSFTFSYSPIRDEKGTIGGVFGVATENPARVTDEERSPDTMGFPAGARASQELSEKVLTSLNDHFVMFDHEWRYTYANDAAARTLGLPTEELIGNIIWELFPEAIGNQFYEELHRARDEGKDISSEHYYEQWDAWFENRIYALPDGISVLSIDITARKKAEEAQRQGEQMLAFALQAARMVAWEWDLEQDLITTSNSQNDIFGLSSLFTGEESYQVVHPEDRAGHRQKVQQTITDGTPYRSEFRIVRHDSGEVSWIEEWGFAVRNAEGVVQKLFGVAMENTERKEAEERLQVIHQLSEAVNRAEAVEQIYELALSGLERVFHVNRAAILLADQQGVMLFQATRGLSATYRARADGQSPRNIDEANPQPVLIPDVSKVDLGDQQQYILEEGIHAIGFIPLVEQNRLLGKFMLYYSQPHIFSEAEVQWAQTIARHVAHALDRKQADLRLQTYTHTLESLNHTQLSLAAELDLEKLLQMVTDVSTELSGAQFGAFFYNVTEEGKDAHTLYTISGAPHETFADVPMPGSTPLFEPTFRGESVIRLADVTKDPRYGQNPPYFGLHPGHLPIRSYLAVPVISRAGDVIGGLFFGHSHPGVFTEQVEQLVSGIASQAAIMIENARLYAQIKEREVALRELNATLEQRVEKRTAELQRSNRELDQFAYVASHDLKAPLRAIHHLATWISQDANEFLPAPSKEHLGKLQGRVRRMETLLDDMLAYSRAGRQRHPAEEVAIAALIHDVIEMTSPPLGFSVKVSGKLPVMRVERIPLETVFRNLIGNAIKHHHRPSEGNVEISAQEQEDFVEFTVKDDGPGIDAGYHQRIFEMFQTLQPRDLVEGSGVGLAVVKKSVESRGGTIQVESGLGEGATFRFTWPKRIASHLDNF